GRPGTARPASGAASSVRRQRAPWPAPARYRPCRPAGLVAPADRPLGLFLLAVGGGERFGLQQVSDRAAQGGAHLVQVVEADGDGLAAPERGDLAEGRGEPGLLEGLQQVAGPPDVALGRGPAQVPLHRRFPLSIVRRCTARPAAARLAFSGSAWAVARYETVVVGRSWPSIFCTSHS